MICMKGAKLWHGKACGMLASLAASAELVRLFGIAASLGVGAWLFKYVEKPMDVWLRKGGALSDLLRPRLSFRHENLRG